MPAYRAYRPVLCRHTVRTGRYAVIGCKLKQNANEGCNSCATVVQALQDLFYVLLYVLFYLVSLLKPHDHRDWKYTRTVAYVTKLKYQIERSCMICVSVQYLPVVVKTISYFFRVLIFCTDPGYVVYSQLLSVSGSWLHEGQIEVNKYVLKLNCHITQQLSPCWTVSSADHQVIKLLDQESQWFNILFNRFNHAAR